MDSIIAIDIETTGLDPETDAIIEIGAVRFKGGRVETEWSSLVNPQRHVPEFVTSLTGIDDPMLRNAPPMRDVTAQLQAFVGELPVIGHNVRFDLGFLKRYVPFGQNPVLDTYELAAVLLPNASRYSLGSLGRELGVLLPATHRALDDARVTQAVYVRLMELARELPTTLIAELVRLSAKLDWMAAPAFRDLLGSRGTELSKRRATPGREEPKYIPESGPALTLPAEPTPVDADEAAAILEHGGSFSKYFENYEYRPEQVQMLRAVSDALSHDRHLIVEAGTGVGKSFAYLIPASMFAIKNSTRVVISTNTINLQDQLIRKDIPDLEAALHLGLRAAVLKGRANYLCPRRLDGMRHVGPRNEEEMRVLAKVLVWQLSDASGDRNSINLNGPVERDVWQRLSADDDGCTSETCVKRTGGACPFHRARTAAQTAHLLVVNHALLLSDVATEGKVLPDYAYVIVDEGHHLETATTNALSFRFTQFDFDRLLREAGGSGAGLIGTVLDVARPLLAPGDFGLLKQRVGHATDLAFRLQELGRSFFDHLAGFAAQQREGETASPYPWQARILPSTRTLPGWDAVEISWDAAQGTWGGFMAAVLEVYEAAATLYANGQNEFEDVIGDISTSYRRMVEAQRNLTAMIGKPSADQVYWIEVRPNGGHLSLNAAPLRVGPLIEKVLWHEKSSVVLTSATLTTHGEFQYLKNTLAADEAEEIQVGSPFDYENSTLLYVANDIPEPNTHEYEQTLFRAMISTATATGGRMLALFTSYAALKKAARAIAGPLAAQDIAVYEHGEGASANMLLESFKSADRAVLLGTRSFWEGVDVPGSALSVLFITKLPFDVPTDPLISARAETYEDPFQEYYLPEAILRFRQGFGRLIRTASDRGVVAILDRRVLTKQYGRLFLESLPTCTQRQGPTANLPREAGRWLGV